MAKVEMSLNEYNEMRDELLLCKDLITKLLTPVDDEYYYTHLKDGSYDTISLSTDTSVLSEDQKNFMRNIIRENMPERFKELIQTEEYRMEDPYGAFRIDLCNVIRVVSEDKDEPF